MAVNHFLSSLPLDLFLEDRIQMIEPLILDEQEKRNHVFPSDVGGLDEEIFCISQNTPLVRDEKH